MTQDQAHQFLDPSLGEGMDDADRKAVRAAAAQGLVASVSAQEAYWSSRPELEQLRAQAEGHIGVVPHPDSPAAQGDTPAAGAVTSSASPETVEGSATEEPEALGAGDAELDKLRQQVRDLGGEPEA